jgi:hypothetical protein
MNERIEQLAQQCTEYITGTLDGDYEKFDYKKFAELIVLECSAFVYNYPQKYLTRNQAREICLGMEENFGVEE